MAQSIPAAARQLEHLLKNTLIPLAKTDAPLILFDAPPRSSHPLEIREEDAAPLPSPTRTKSYPGFYRWTREEVNFIAVPVLGCIFEGEVDYNVRNPPGGEGWRWVVPVRQGTLFVVSPRIPFTSSKIAWERPEPERAYARGVLFHLRRDGINCRSYTWIKAKFGCILIFFCTNRKCICWENGCCRSYSAILPKEKTMNLKSVQKKGFTLIELLIVIAIITILAAILFPVFARAREDARPASCQSNLKQLGLGIMQYTQDYDEYFPKEGNRGTQLMATGFNSVAPTGDGQYLHLWMHTIYPYVKSAQVYNCPSANFSYVDNFTGA